MSTVSVADALSARPLIGYWSQRTSVRTLVLINQASSILGVTYSFSYIVLGLMLLFFAFRKDSCQIWNARKVPMFIIMLMIVQKNVSIAATFAPKTLAWSA